MSGKPALERVLVTGGCGFVGSNFVRCLLAQDEQVEILNLDLLGYAGSTANLDGLVGAERHRLVQGDIADEALVARVFAEHAPDTVVHFAAETHVDRAIHDPASALRSNVVGTFTLLEAARRSWHGRQDVRFHHVSTDEVYGSRPPEEAPSREGATYMPSSPYSATKAGSDHLVQAWAKTYGLPVSTTLSCNLYGPRQHPEKLIPLMILNAAAGRALPVYGDGLQVREWLHVDDQCAAILAVLRRGEAGAVYNVSSERSATNLEIVGRICGVMDVRRPAGAPHAQWVRHVADRPGHDVRYALDARAIRRDLGWAPQIDLEAGLASTVDWYLNHPSWVEAATGPSYQAWVEKNYARR